MSGRRLIMWRHGRTEWNVSKRIQGQTDIDLDEVGLQQARQAAPLLATENPNLIITSDLLRTRRTAQALADVTGLAVHPDERLRERCFGPWEGLSSTELNARYGDEYAQWRAGGQPNVPGIESEEDLNARMLAGIDDALAATDGTICLVTHGGAARRAVLGLLEWDNEVGARLEPLGNCRWSELRHTVRGWRIHSYNTGPATGAAGPTAPATSADAEPPAVEELTPAPTHSELR